MKKILLLIYFLNIVLFSFSQTAKVQGKIQDKTTNAPVEYSTVSVFSLPDSTFITGVITNSKGHFEIDKLKFGKYYLSASFLGYKDAFSQSFILSKQTPMHTISVLKIEPDNIIIDNVEVIGKQHQVDYKLDKKVISVNQSVVSASMTATEVLESLPSISVDVDGEVSLRGSTGFTVLVDGKPSVLDASDVLQQIPASQIKNIEIITNPSAKYNPDGTAGIINIITTNHKLEGWQGVVNLKGGSFGMYGGDFLLSYKHKKINTFIGADYADFSYPRSSYSERISTFDNVTSKLISKGDDDMNRVKRSARAGFEWDITEKSALSFDAKFGKFNFEHSSEDKFIRILDITKTDTTFESSTSNSGRGGYYFSASSNFSHTFNNEPKHQLTAEAFYNSRSWQEFSETRLLNETNQSPSGLYSTEDGPKQRFQVKTDYTRPWKFGFIETGLQVRGEVSKDETSLQILDSATNDFIVLDSTLNTFNYNRNIYSAYGILNGHWSKFDYKVGLRLENTHRTIESEKASETYKINVWNLFPTLHFSYGLSEEHQFMASYSRRIDRPRPHYLEPTVKWMDMMHARQGNPDLQPEYINAMEIGYIFKHKKTNLSVDAYYHIRNNKIERIEEVFTDKTSLYTFQNVGKDYSLGIDAMYSVDAFPFWEISLMGNAYHYKIVSTKETSSLNWSAGMHNTFRVGKFVKLQLNGMYRSASVTSQGSRDGYYSVNAAVRTDFFKRSLSVSVQARDILTTGTYVYTVEAENLYSYNEMSRKTPYLSVALSYRINNYKAKRGEKDDIDDEEF